MGDEPCDVGPILEDALPGYSLHDLPAPNPQLDALARAVDRIGALQAEVRELTARVADLEGLVANHVGVDVPSGPDWEDLRGMAPDATGGLPSEVFVREQRDGWRDEPNEPDCGGYGQGEVSPSQADGAPDEGVRCY